MSELARPIESVRFAGADLACVYDAEDDEIYVSLKRACEGLGIDYRSQRKKLEKLHWATVVLMTTVAEDGKNRRLSMVDLDTLGMWLATIHPSRVSGEAREKVKTYQKECVRVLRRHFFGARSESPAENDDEPRPPIAEREVRHPDGRVVIERYDTGHLTHRRVVSTTAAAKPPEPESLEPDVPVELLRHRFHRGLSAAISGLPEYQRLAREYRGEFHQRINRQLKGFIGRERDAWRPLDYANAVHWLDLQYGIDIRWVLHPQDDSGAGGNQ